MNAHLSQGYTNKARNRHSHKIFLSTRRNQLILLTDGYCWTSNQIIIEVSAIHNMSHSAITQRHKLLCLVYLQTAYLFLDPRNLQHGRGQ